MIDKLLPILCGVVAAIPVALVPLLIKLVKKYPYITFRIWPPMIKLEKE